jgi:Protein of unknown function (DUF3667)
MSAGIEPSACPNCGAALGGAYCAACGQKAGSLNPTLGDFLRDLTQELLNVDGKVFGSVRLLLTRPGFLTLEQFAGRRVRYVAPIRLYLLFSLLFFATIELLPSQLERALTHDAGLPTQALDEQRTQEAIAAVNRAMNVWVPRAMFLLVPVFGGLVMLLGRRSGLTYLQHLYFGLHVQAAWFAAFSVSVLANVGPQALHTGTLVGVPVTLYAGWYLWFAFRRVYRTTLPGAFWRALVVAGAYWLVLIAVVLAISLPPALRIGNRGP